MTPISLVLQQFRFTLRAIDPLALDQHPGSALRGAIFRALLKRFCAMPQQPFCAMCPLLRQCPVASLVAPLRDEHPRGRDVPRPFVMEPPLFAAMQEEGVTFQRNQQFSFGITLIGSATKLFPYLALSTQFMEQDGLGRPLKENFGRRGRFIVEQISSCNPFTQKETVLFRSGNTAVTPPSEDITEKTIQQYIAILSSEKLALQFLTPMRLIQAGKLVHIPDPAILLQRLAERLDALEQTYSIDEPQDEINHTGRWRDIAATANLVLDMSKITWVDSQSYSNRQQRSLPTGGFVGRAIYAGDFSPELHALLAWGELVHVGKDVVKGNGWYQIIH